MISLAAVLVLAALAWGVAVLLLGHDPGLEPAEPDGHAVPLPSARPLTEADLEAVRFDTAPRGYRMQQVDQALHRAAYDIGYKEELIGVLQAEVTALREGRLDEAEALRQARDAAVRPRTAVEPELTGAEPTEPAVSAKPTEPAVSAKPTEPAEGAAGEPDDSIDDDLAPTGDDLGATSSDLTATSGDLATATARRRGARSADSSTTGRLADGEK